MEMQKKVLATREPQTAAEYFIKYHTEEDLALFEELMAATAPDEKKET